MRLKIAQINAQRSAAAAANLEMIMREESIDILCLQEPYAYEGIVRGYTSPGLRIIQPNKKSPWAAAVVAEKSIDVFQLSHLETEHITCFEVSTEHESICIINVYCQFSLEIEPFLRRIEEICDKLKGKEIIITMDANAKSLTWHSNITDDRGKQIEEFLIVNDISVINVTSDLYTFSSINGESNIDISMCSSNLIGKVSKWKVLPICTTSDHNIITFEIDTLNTATLKNIQKIHGYNIRKANWDKFKEQISLEQTKELIENCEKLKPNKAAKLFNKKLEEICKLSIPRRKCAEKPVPWWSEELNFLRKRANKSKRQMNRARRLNLDDHVERLKNVYKSDRNKYVKEIKRRKTETWQNFVTAEGNKDPWSIPYKIVREKIRKTNLLGSLELPDGTMTSNWKESVNALLDKIVPNDDTGSEKEKHIKIRQHVNKYQNSNLEENITKAEIECAIKRLKNNKAPGMDDMKSEIIKVAWKCNKEIFVAIYNNCLRNERFPTLWKEAKLKIILKDKNKDQTKIGSYRPIALLPVMAKIYENIIVKRIEIAYKEKRLDSPRQYGFKIGKSTEDALLKFRNIVKGTEEKYLVALFVDIEGAFDNLWWPSIKARLVEANCSSSLVKIVEDYFRKRAMIVQTLHQKECRYMKKGCPQGSIIGPFAWNWSMDPLLQETDARFHCGAVEVLAYADDIAFLIKGRTRAEIEETGKDLKKIIDEWCDINKLRVSPTKTVAILMKGKLNKEKMPNIRIENSKIKYVEEVRYLGMRINKQLNFISHVKQLKDKLTSFVIAIRRIAKAEWGIKAKITRTLYKAAVLPIMTYGASAWYDKCDHAIVKRHLLAAQRVMLLMHLKAYRITSTSALQVVGGFIPLDLEIIKLGVAGCVRRNLTVKWKDYSFNTMDNDMNVDRKREYVKIKEEINKEWQARWDEDPHGRHTYKFIKTVKFREERPWFNPGRGCIFLLTGYGPINSTLYKRRVVTSKECPMCKHEETAEHIMFECELYKTQRYRELELNRCNWHKLIETKEEYKKFSDFSRKVFEKRNTYIKELERNRSASTRLGTGNVGISDG